jgi:hypothetical protein
LTFASNPEKSEIMTKVTVSHAQAFSLARARHILSGLMRKTQAVSLTATFVALHAVLAFISLGIVPWRNWSVY